MKPVIPKSLPIRIAQNRYAGLEHYNDAYFERLCRCGYEGQYLQMSPFDPLSGNYNGFWNNYHLIYLYDIVRGPQTALYQDYIHTVCERSKAYGLNTYLALWEPRLPFSAWSETPPEWRGNGGWMRNEKGNYTSFCWRVPEAVEYWKKMCLDTFAELPDIAGCHLGVGDNEATICDDTCPTCKGYSDNWERAYRDIFGTLNEVRKSRNGDFRITIYGWWMSDDLIVHCAKELNDPNTLLIGRSSQGITQMIEGEEVPGKVGDMTMVSGECGSRMVERKGLADQLNIKLVDMTAWSHPAESWWLPSPPDPGFAWEKMNALREVGAHGWYDFDCGCIEDGSVADMIALLTMNPDLLREEAVEHIISGIFIDSADIAMQAYSLYHKGKQAYPVSLDFEDFDALSLRLPGMGNTLFGPFMEADMTFKDMRIYPRSIFAPYCFMEERIMAAYNQWVPKATEILKTAHELIQSCPEDSEDALREKAAFEIYYRHFRAIQNYTAFAQTRWDYIHQTLDKASYQEKVKTIAADELENTESLQLWMDRNPGVLGNPCWDLIGMLNYCWTGLDFNTRLLGPKITSLEALIKGKQPDFLRRDNIFELSQWTAPFKAFPSDWQTHSIR